MAFTRLAQTARRRGGRRSVGVHGQLDEARVEVGETIGMTGPFGVVPRPGGLLAALPPPG